MKFQLKYSLVIASILLGGYSTLAQSASQVAVTADSQAEHNRQQVVNFYNQFFNQHETEKSSQIIAENYIQHNPDVPDGKAPFVSYFTDYFKRNPQSHARIVRSAVEGDLVWLHVHSTQNKNDLGQSVIDIFRLDHGKIVEHWDVIQAVPKQAANSNSMF